ncbi:hypothetical protein TNCV_4956171 [Trichonephila clavipes]|nr:hypothetical protein TNCV_4956171 [Trichonephila clavipes]
MWAYAAGNILGTWNRPKYQGFDNDSKMMEMSLKVTVQVKPETTPNEDRYIFGSYCQKKQTEHSIKPVGSFQPLVRQF